MGRLVEFGILAPGLHHGILFFSSSFETNACFLLVFLGVVVKSHAPATPFKSAVFRYPFSIPQCPSTSPRYRVNSRGSLELTWKFLKRQVPPDPGYPRIEGDIRIRFCKS